MRNNQSGLTLVELLGALAGTIVIVAAVTFLVVQLQTGYDKITDKERIMNEAEGIVNHIVQAARKETVVAETWDPGSGEPAFLLRFVTLDENGNLSGKRLEYAFDAANRTLAVTQIEPGSSRTVTLSANVKQMDVSLDEGGRKIAIDLVMQLSDGTEYALETAAYIPRL